MNGKVFFKYLATHYISDREKYNEFYLVDVDARKKNKCNKRKMLKISLSNGVKATCHPRVQICCIKLFANSASSTGSSWMLWKMVMYLHINEIITYLSFSSKVVEDLINSE